jgi:hypothetical protein
VKVKHRAICQNIRKLFVNSREKRNRNYEKNKIKNKNGVKMKEVKLPDSQI